MEEGNLSRRLAFDCRHGYSQEEYVMKTEREREREREREKQREPGTLLLSTLVRCEDNVETVKSLTYLATLTVTAVSCIAPPTG